MKAKLLETLKQYWGYDDFRPMQYQIISAVMSGRDTLALMPTGGGKSLTYQLPTMVSEGMCIVVTPLIALMKDQVDSLRNRGISAVAVHSGMSRRQIDVALDNCVYGDVKFLYIAPERLKSDVFRLRARCMDVSLVAVDEAHCISQWGYDFRPSYLNIAALRDVIPQATFLALTASATPRVVDDIMQKLEFETPNVMRSSFARDNLCYVVRRVDDKHTHLERIIESVQGSGIVYARKKETVEKLCADFQAMGVSASFYHAGLPTVERAIRQDEWISGKVRVMFATNAFGMGIDKSDVRFVVHYSMSDSLEGYYQEAGRAGRDGALSYAVLLYSPKDFGIMRRRLESNYPSLEYIKKLYERICSYLQIAIGDGRGSSYSFDVFDFCRREECDTQTVIGAVDVLSRNDYMTYIEESERPARIVFKVSRDELYNVEMDAITENVIGTIMRCYNGVFSDFKAIDERFIASKCGCSERVVHNVLKELWRRQVMIYVPANNSPVIYMNEERLPASDLYISPDTYSRRKTEEIAHFDALVEYAENQSICRSVFLGNYFGDECLEPCGCCDVCRAQKRVEKCGSVSALILKTVGSGSYTARELAVKLSLPAEQVQQSLTELVETGDIKTLADGKLSLTTDTPSE